MTVPDVTAVPVVSFKYISGGVLMLSVNPIARVVVNAVRSSASPSSFDTGLLLIKDANFTSAKRLKSYASSSAAAAGLVAT